MSSLTHPIPGLSEDDPVVKHIHFLGMDKDAATGEVRRVLGQGGAVNALAWAG